VDVCPKLRRKKERKKEGISVRKEFQQGRNFSKEGISVRKEGRKDFQCGLSAMNSSKEF
jgi:hypothetical protein